MTILDEKYESQLLSMAEQGELDDRLEFPFKNLEIHLYLNGYDQVSEFVTPHEVECCSQVS